MHHKLRKMRENGGMEEKYYLSIAHLYRQVTWQTTDTRLNVWAHDSPGQMTEARSCHTTVSMARSNDSSLMSLNAHGNFVAESVC